MAKLLKSLSLILLLICSAHIAYSQVNDNFIDATELTSIDNFCSAPGTFTTTGATPDEALPSNWTAGPHTNVWYKFTATTTEVSIRVEVGSMNFPRLALHDAAKAEIKSVANAGSSNAIGMSVNTLTVGDTYYINVSNGPNGGHSGTFVLCVDDAVSQDYPAGAVTITHSNDNCSALAGYNTRIGTPDGTKPSNWANGPNANVWFRFQATATEVALNLNVAGVSGAMKFPRLALYDNAMQPLVDVGDDGSLIDIGLSHTGLTIGDWYYINVDNGPNTGHRGNFTLCIDTEASYDYPSGAIELTNTDNYCSGLAEFTTQIATPDGSRPSAWTNGPNANVWFTFIAGSADVTIEVKTGSTEGNVLYPKVALHDASISELASVNDAGQSVDVSLVYNSLTSGQRYYINVDNGVNQGQRGAFTLCVNNPGSVPTVPTNFTATTTGTDQINLSWDDVATETSYTLWRSAESGTGFSILIDNIPENTITYSDQGLAPNTPYFYYLEAVNGSGSSAPTAEVSATTNASPNPAPSTVRTFLIDLGRSSTVTTGNWNNVAGAQESGLIITDIIDDSGSPSTIDFEVFADASNDYENGFNKDGYNGDVLGYPTSANSDSYFAHGSGGIYKLKDLDPSKQYDLKIFGSRTASGGGRVGTYTIDGITQTLDALNNSSNTISFNDIQPDANNEIVLEFGVAVGSSFGYLNVLEVAEKVSSSPNIYTVEWTNVVGADVGDDNVVTKNLAAVGWNAGASSMNVLPLDEDGHIAFTATESNKNKMVGLSNIDLDEGTSTIRYAFFLQQSGIVNIFESGLNKGNFGAYQSGDIFKIAKNEQSIEYYINDVLTYTSTLEVQSPLVVDISLYSPGSSSPSIIATFDSSAPIPNLNSNVTWNNVTGAIVDQNNTLEKTLGTNAQWDAGASSLNVLPEGSDGWMELVADAANQTRMVGLSNADIGTDYRPIRYAIYLQSNGNLNVYESGTNKGNFGTYGAGDIIRIERNAGTITYHKNETVFYTSNLSSEGVLIVDVSMYNKDAKVFGVSTSFNTSVAAPQVTSNVQWTNLVNSFVEVDNVLSRNSNVGWDAGASSANVLPASQDGWLEFYADKTIDNKAIGLTELDIDVHQNTIRYSIFLQNNGTYSIYESGIHRGNFGAYGAGDIFKIERVGKTISYGRNEQVFYTSTLESTASLMADASLNSANSDFVGVNVSFPLGTQVTLPISNVEWTNLTGVSIETGNHLTKTGTTGWNAGASSLNELMADEDGWMEFVAGRSIDIRAIGLSESDTDVDFTSIDYAIVTQTNATYNVYESGVHKGSFGTYGAGDKFRIERTGGTISYLHNGTPFYTSTVSSNGKLLIDAALRTTGARALGVTTSFRIPEQGEVADLLEIQSLRDLFESTGGSSWTSQTDSDPSDDWPEGSEWDGITSINEATSWFGIMVVDGDIEKLRLSSNNLAGTLPSTLGNLKALDELSLAINSLSGAIPGEIGQLIKLEQLIIRDNNFNGVLPDELSNLIALTTIEVNDNNLEGELPLWLGNLVNLRKLHLDHNQFTGSIPSSLGNLSQLRYLNLHFNQLSGVIPASLGNLSKLRSLSLVSNELSGDIPASLGGLADLWYLQLSGNNLSGEIPSELSNLNSLFWLYLNDNSLQGTIPNVIGGMPSLTDAVFSNNEFTGLEMMSDHPNRQNLTLAVFNNYLNFGDLEANIPSGLEVIDEFNYTPQLDLSEIQLITLAPDESVINDRGEGEQTQYQWQEWSGTEWLNLAGKNTRDLSLDNFQTGKRYRCEMTNTWVSGLILHSSIFEVSKVQSTYYAIANGDWTDGAIWSLEEGGVSVNQVPSIADIVIIDGYQIQATSAVECSGITIDGDALTQLSVRGPNAHVIVHGNVVIKGNYRQAEDLLTLEAGGKLECVE
ncbi:MAG: fibronectin type III domain-containing protein [Bacteroidota bacterium]